MKTKPRILLIGLILSWTSLYAQENVQPFWKDIQSFRKQDSISVPASGQILFLGSSSITKWKKINDDFPGYGIINRGFGGSCLTDILHYGKDVILPYKPRQVVIYCGENDLASSDTVSAESVFRRFELLFHLIRKYYPDVPLAFISMKPSPSRVHLMEKMEAGNKLIKHFLNKKNNAAYIDVYHSMLNRDGSPKKELFLSDNLHMNAEGYALWKKIIEPHLLK